jgi:hypothetical protein
MAKETPMHRRVATHLVVLLLGVGLGAGSVALGGQQASQQPPTHADIVQLNKTLNFRLRQLCRILARPGVNYIASCG